MNPSAPTNFTRETIHVKQISHPPRFKSGVRLIMRVWRNKEAAEGKRPGRTLISTGPEAWDKMTSELLAECIPGERVYASAEARNVERAIRIFKERQLVADYDDPEVRHAFYNDCKTRWLSCLGAPRASDENLFLFDCDTPADHATLMREMAVAPVDFVGPDKVIHTYETKNGVHVLTTPFNPGLLSIPMRNILQKNALILVGWK